eukprot:scaffold16447_cov116-Isochrysis_galbana.AAC.1
MPHRCWPWRWHRRRCCWRRRQSTASRPPPWQPSQPECRAAQASRKAPESAKSCARAGVYSETTPGPAVPTHSADATNPSESQDLRGSGVRISHTRHTVLPEPHPCRAHEMSVNRLARDETSLALLCRHLLLGAHDQLPAALALRWPFPCPDVRWSGCAARAEARLETGPSSKHARAPAAQTIRSATEGPCRCVLPPGAPPPRRLRRPPCLRRAAMS